MKIVFISDTHGFHHQLNELEGDLIIHAGDVTSRGKEAEVVDFLTWFGELKFDYKIFIAGNHDFFFEKVSLNILDELIPKNVIYLNDSGISIDDINIWGSPIQPWFHDWAFNKKRGSEIKKHWDIIPNNTDILITHGPPFGIGDKTVYQSNVGCEDLLEKVAVLKPKIHVFGHIHEDYGIKEKNGTKFINASVLNVRYQMVNPPIVLNYKI